MYTILTVTSAVSLHLVVGAVLVGHGYVLWIGKSVGRKRGALFTDTTFDAVVGRGREGRQESELEPEMDWGRVGVRDAGGYLFEV